MEPGVLVEIDHGCRQHGDKSGPPGMQRSSTRDTAHLTQRSSKPSQMNIISVLPFLRARWKAKDSVN